MSEDPRLDGLNEFLDAVAAKAPTPGGGGVAAAVGALSCAMGRMVGGYSPGKNAPEADGAIVGQAVAQLERADRLLRALIVEDARAYSALSDAGRKLNDDPATASDHDAAVGVAIAVPLEVAALAAESLSVLERLLPASNRYLLSDLGVAAVLADATVRAACYLVRVNLRGIRDGDSRRGSASDADRLIIRARASLGRIESILADRV